MYELLGARGAGSAIVELALTLCGAPFCITEASPGEQGPAQDRLRLLNPLVQVPTLVLPDGQVLTESAAMLLHLADRHPHAGLAPTPGHPTRDRFLRWLIFVVANVYPSFTYGDEPARWVEGREAQDGLRRSTDAYRERLWRQLEAEAGGPFFLGDARSALDLYVAVMSRWRPPRAWFAVACPRLHGIAETVENDPALAAVFTRNFAGGAPGI